MNSKSRRIGVSVALTACTVVALAATLRVRAADEKRDRHFSGDDKKFVEKAANDGMMEVAAGKVAQTNANNDAVKRFGARMVEDHSKANHELMRIAEEHDVKLEGELHGAPKEHYDRLAAFKGDKFDREYVSQMVKDHEEDVSDFEKEAKHGDDSQLRSFAEQQLPTLREHLKMAKELEAHHEGRDEHK